MITLLFLVNLLSIYGLYILIKHKGLDGLIDYEYKTGKYMGFVFALSVIGVIIIIVEVCLLIANYLP